MRPSVETATPPAILEMATVAKLMGWRTERVRRWLRKEGAAFKLNGRWVTKPRLLQEHFGWFREESEE